MKAIYSAVILATILLLGCESDKNKAVYWWCMCPYWCDGVGDALGRPVNDPTGQLCRHEIEEQASYECAEDLEYLCPPPSTLDALDPICWIHDEDGCP